VKNSWGQTTQHSSKGTVEGSYTGKTKGYGGIVSTGAISCQCARIDGRRTTSHNRQRELAEKSKYKLEAQSWWQEQGAHIHILMHICTFQAVHTHSAGTKRRAHLDGLLVHPKTIIQATRCSTCPSPLSPLIPSYLLPPTLPLLPPSSVDSFCTLCRRPGKGNSTPKTATARQGEARGILSISMANRLARVFLGGWRKNGCAWRKQRECDENRGGYGEIR
jgi:hypothetical protein